MLIGHGTPDDGDIDLEVRILQPFLAVQFDHFDDILGGDLVHFAAFQTGVDEGAEPDLGDHARPMGSNLAPHLADDALR